MGKKYLYVFGPVLLAGAILAGLPFINQLRKANKVLETEKRKAKQQQVAEIQRHHFSLAPSSQSRLILGASEVRDAVYFQDRIYAATAGGLMIYTTKGKLQEHWTTTEGLPSLDLTSAAVARGALWIGTRDSGLLRFQENNWQQWKPVRKEWQSIQALLSTGQGTLLAGTEAGVLRYDGIDFRPFYMDALGKSKITRLAGDDHRLFVGTYNHGLFLYANGSLNRFKAEDGLRDTMVTDIIATDDGALVGSPGGIQRLKNGTFEPFAKNLFVASMQQSPSAIWAATYDRGVVRLPLQKVARPTPGSQSTVLTERGAQLRWVEKTLVAFAPGKSWYLESNGKWQEWSADEPVLGDSNISSLLRTKDGNLWIGTFDRGLSVLTPDFRQLSRLQDDTFFCINYLAQDAAGNVYVSTANGLAIVSPDGSKRIYRQADGLMSDRVMQAIPLDPDGKRVAIATAEGFTLKVGEAFRSVYAFHGLVNNHVYTIAARGDQLYLGTLGGISSLHKMQVTESWTQMDSGLRRNWVNALLAVNDRLLVGTYGSGIQERTPSGDWIAFDGLPADFEVNPNALFFDGRYVFCGTLDRGFYFYDTRRNAWKQYLKGLPGPNVTAFATDGHFLYVATDHGMLQISYDTLHTIPDIR